MADATAWIAEHAGELTGLPAEAAAARVREAGLTPRIVPPGSAFTLEFRPARVDLHVDAEDLVAAVRAG